MQTECSTTLFEFAPVEDRKVVAGFDGGTMTSNAGGLLLGGADKAIKLIERVAKCFVDRRDPSLIEHSVATLVGIFGLALGYGDAQKQLNRVLAFTDCGCLRDSCLHGQRLYSVDDRRITPPHPV